MLAECNNESLDYEVHQGQRVIYEPRAWYVMINGLLVLCLLMLSLLDQTNKPKLSMKCIE
jgi:hypothetical protein